MSEKRPSPSRPKGPRRPRSKAESEKRRRLLVVSLIVVAVVSALSVVGAGYYNTSVKPWNQRIVKVNGTVFDMRDFVKFLRLYGITTTEYADFAVSTMEENELGRQYLKSEFPDVDLGDVTGDEAVHAKLREMLNLSDNATQDEFDEAYSNWLENLALKDRRSSEKDLMALYLKPLLITEELTKQIGDRDYPTTDNFEHAQVQALLVSGSDNATRLRARWEAGEAFDSLSADAAVSSSQRDAAADNVTQINWVAKGIKSEAFDNCTFTATPGVLSNPIQDNDDAAKYWLIKVVAREFRPLTEADRETLISAAYSKWLEEAKASEENKVVRYVTSNKVAWAVDHANVSSS